MTLKRILQEIFLTLCFVGRLKASGTFGSLVSIPIGLGILFFSQETLFLSALLVGAIAIKQIDIYEQNGGMHDDKSIVIDELVGMWIAMSFFAPKLLLDKGMWWFVGAMAVSFVLFRIFDICKPSWIGRIDREVKGGLGVVGDDVLAGLCAGICAKLLVFGAALVFV